MIETIKEWHNGGTRTEFIFECEEFKDVVFIGADYEEFSQSNAWWWENHHPNLIGYSTKNSPAGQHILQVHDAGWLILNGNKQPKVFAFVYEPYNYFVFNNHAIFYGHEEIVIVNLSDYSWKTEHTR